MLVASAILLTLSLAAFVGTFVFLVHQGNELWRIFGEREREIVARFDGRVAELLRRQAEGEERWAAERQNLLDRIQAPHLATAHLIPQGEVDQGPTDEEVDEKFATHPASRVPWDEDLLPLTPPEQDAVGG